MATSTPIAWISSAVRAAAVAARLACDSTPSDAHTLWAAIGDASERASAAAAWAVYSSIMWPESGPGSAARNGVRPLILGSRIALTRPAISDAECANAARSPSSAAPSSAAWKLPVGKRPTLVDQGVLGARVELAGEHVVERPQRVVRDAVHLGQHAERIGILDEPVGRPGIERRAGEQLAHPLRHRGLAARAAPCLNARVEHDRVGIERLERQRCDLEPPLV